MPVGLVLGEKRLHIHRSHCFDRGLTRYIIFEAVRRTAMLNLRFSGGYE